MHSVLPFTAVLKRQDMPASVVAENYLMQTVNLIVELGWPSFREPIKENAVSYYRDSTFGMVRIEVLCNTCDAHLGYVFLDGPMLSGLLYCINAVLLKKIAVKKK